MRKSLLLILFLCVNPFTGMAQLEANLQKCLQDAEKEVQSKKSYWERTTKMATSPQNKTIHILYINGKYSAAFKDAATCQMERNNFLSQIERILERVYNEYKRSGGKVSSSDTQIKREFLNKIKNACSCKMENNPNYKASSVPQNSFSNNFPLNTTPTDNNPAASGNASTTFITGGSTQHDNIFDAPSARGNTAVMPQNNNNATTISVSFAGIGNYIDPNNTPPLFRPEAGIIAGINVATVSTEILFYFRNNGIDNHFASKEIERVLTEKYGVPLGLLPANKQSEYINDYNMLSKAVEEDIKKVQEEMKNKQNLTYLKEFENYNNSLIDKRKTLLKEANEWELREKVYNNATLPVNEYVDKKILEEAKDAFLKSSAELGIPEEEATKKMNEIVKEMQDESFRRNAARSTFAKSIKDHDIEGAVDNGKFVVKAEFDNVSLNEQADAYSDLGVGIKNAFREEKITNQKNYLRDEVQTLSQNIESNNRLIEQITNNDLESANFKISQNIANGTSQNAYNNSQQQRLIDESLKQIEFNNRVQNFNIQNISEAPKIEDSSLKYFQNAAKDAH